MSLTKVFMDAKDKYVTCTILYGKSSKLYVDAEGTIEVTYDEIKDLYFKGIRIYDTTDKTYYEVASFKDATGTVTIKDTDSTANTYTVASA